MSKLYLDWGELQRDIMRTGQDCPDQLIVYLKLKYGDIHNMTELEELLDGLTEVGIDIKARAK